MVDHAPFFDVNRQVVLKVLNSCRIFVNQGAQAFPGQSALMADLNTLDILCIMSTIYKQTDNDGSSKSYSVCS